MSDAQVEEFHALLLGADRVGLQQAIRAALAAGQSAEDLVLRVISPALNAVGERWSRHEASLTQVYAAGRIAEELVAELLPALCPSHLGQGTVVIGNAPGDCHGLGRQIVATFLRLAGFEVIDLGLDVSPHTFVAQARSSQARVIAISALMVHTAMRVVEVRRLLDEENMGDVNVIVGGAPFNMHPHLYQRVGADAMGRDAGEAVNVVRRLLAPEEDCNTFRRRNRHRGVPAAPKPLCRS